MQVDVSRYKRLTGRLPRGRAYWMFRLETDRVTERDHYWNSLADETFASAAKRAIALAQRRRAQRVVLLP